MMRGPSARRSRQCTVRGRTWSASSTRRSALARRGSPCAPCCRRAIAAAPSSTSTVAAGPSVLSRSSTPSAARSPSASGRPSSWWTTVSRPSTGFRPPSTTREALRWTAAHLDELAGPGAPIVVAGDSAGGNLAAVVARYAGRDGLPEIAAQILAYPVTDCDLSTSSYTSEENQLVLSRDSMVWFWDHYVPDTSERSHPDVSPLAADDRAGLPPAIVTTAEYDVLRDEGEAYVGRLRDAGVRSNIDGSPARCTASSRCSTSCPAARAALSSSPSASRRS